MSGSRQPIVEFRDVHKNYGHVTVLRGVSCTMFQGEVTALVGDNGAGKSTLIKIICGAHQQDSGQLFFEGRETRWNNPVEARQAGVETVYQDLALVDSLSIARNFFLGKEPLRNGWLKTLDQPKMQADALAAIRELGIELKNPRRLVSDLSGGERKSIAIARSLYFRPKLLILDEPIAALSIKESKIVLDHLEEVKARGIPVIFITHNVHQVYSIADRFILLERGCILAEVEKERTTAEELIEAVISGRVIG
jgi:simple sugar transport system ATP-binding protein